jgi:hypothetical protein
MPTVMLYRLRETEGYKVEGKSWRTRDRFERVNERLYFWRREGKTFTSKRETNE